MLSKLKLDILTKIKSLGDNLIDSSSLYFPNTKQDVVISSLVELIKDKYIFGVPQPDESGDVVAIDKIRLLSKGIVTTSAKH